MIDDMRDGVIAGSVVLIIVIGLIATLVGREYHG